MPNMNGLESTAVIRVEGLNKETPIIGLSGNARKEQIDLALTTGMNAYITKPYHKKSILDAVDNILVNNQKELMPS